MRPNTTTMLFAEAPELHQGTTSFVASILVHSLAICLIFFGLLDTPQIGAPREQRWVVRTLQLQPAEHILPASVRTSYYPSHTANRKVLQAQQQVKPRISLRVAQAAPGPQTLIQPDLKTPRVLTSRVPLPSLVITSPAQHNPQNAITPMPIKPALHEAALSLNDPNQEEVTAELSLAAQPIPLHTLPLQASSASPVSLPNADRMATIQETVSQATPHAAPATLISLSRLRPQGTTVIVPPVNEAEKVTTPGDPSSAQGLSDDRVNSSSAKVVADASAKDDSIATNADSVTRIALPRNGQFKAVVVGSSLADSFPELPDQWNGRIAYTVYLPVGLSKNWILQYSLPPEEILPDDPGNAHLDAPWPYSIVRPAFAPELAHYGDILIHSFISSTGHFQNPQIVFPQGFPQAQFLLSALQQWKFRPAQLNGKETAVEVLLLIPDLE